MLYPADAAWWLQPRTILLYALALIIVFALFYGRDLDRKTTYILLLGPVVIFFIVGIALLLYLLSELGHIRLPKWM